MITVNTLPDSIKHLFTDSRAITARHIADGDTAFVALRTAVGDGHRFVKELYDKGLRAFVVDSTAGFDALADATFVVAGQGTLDFIINTAGRRLAACRSRQIVITGSNRKTSFKEWISIALKRAGYTVARSPRTWNSAMGAALSVFENAGADADFIITEVGIDAPGQADRIRPLLRPYVGVISSITDEHDAAFASHDAKVAEKLSIVRDADVIYLPLSLDDVPDDDRVCRFADVHDVIGGILGRRVEPSPLPAVSTQVELRSVPGDSIMLIDSFTNDLESLPLSLDIACRRLTDRRLTVFLVDFEGDRDAARSLVADRDGDVRFVASADGVPADLKRDDFEKRLILIKGPAEPLATFFDEARHDTTLQVDLDAVVHNYNVYRAMLPRRTGLIAMVKADAYGLGALEVAKTLQPRGAAYLAVAVIDEGVALRKAGITMPVIVLNPITNRFEDIVRYDLQPTVFSLDELQHIEDGVRPYVRQAPVPVHLKLDTGMHRVGFLENELDALADRLLQSDVLRAASVFSHLATADCPDLTDYMFGQLQCFDRMSSRLLQRLGPDVRRHVLNTAGIMSQGHTQYAYDMARLGIGLYGISPMPGDTTTDLRPAARLVSTIISVKKWDAGTPIGYGCRGVTSRPSVIATVAIGYADGIDRHLGNGNAHFIVDGTACPTIGNVCMDQLMLDITDAVRPGTPAAAMVGRQVEIFGPANPVQTLAQTLGTIPYELLTSVSPRVRRTYFQR